MPVPATNSRLVLPFAQEKTGRSQRTLLRTGTLRCRTMPTKHERIGVVKDATLKEALESVAPIVGVATPTAKVVHDLAIRGARALRDDAAERDVLLRELAARSTSDAPWDREVLARIDGLAAG